MPRPASIVTFERCYLGSWLVSLLSVALAWNSRLAMAHAALADRGTGGADGPDMAVIGLVLGVVVGAVITLTLWWFVARQASTVAKWITVALFALGLLGLLHAVTRGTVPGGVAGVLTVAQWVLQVIAVVMLFRPDAAAWFAAHRRLPVGEQA